MSFLTFLLPPATVLASIPHYFCPRQLEYLLTSCCRCFVSLCSKVPQTLATDYNITVTFQKLNNWTKKISFSFPSSNKLSRDFSAWYLRQSIKLSSLFSAFSFSLCHSKTKCYVAMNNLMFSWLLTLFPLPRKLCSHMSSEKCMHFIKFKHKYSSPSPMAVWCSCSYSGLMTNPFRGCSYAAWCGFFPYC